MTVSGPRLGLTWWSVSQTLVLTTDPILSTGSQTRCRPLFYDVSDNICEHTLQSCSSHLEYLGRPCIDSLTPLGRLHQCEGSILAHPPTQDAFPAGASQRMCVEHTPSKAGHKLTLLSRDVGAYMYVCRSFNELKPPRHGCTCLHTQPIRAGTDRRVKKVGSCGLAAGPLVLSKIYIYSSSTRS